MTNKIIWTSIAILLCTAGYARKNIGQMFEEFAEAKGAQKLNFSAGTATGAKIVLLKNADENVRKRFEEAIKTVKDENFETMINSNENGRRMKVFARVKDKELNELVVFSTGNSPLMLRLDMKIKLENIDIKQLVNDYGIQ